MFDAHHFHVFRAHPNLGVMPCGTARGILGLYKAGTEEALLEDIAEQARVEAAEIERREEKKAERCGVDGRKRGSMMVRDASLLGLATAHGSDSPE